MRTNSHLAVGSPTVRVLAILAATLLLAVTLAAAGAGAQRLLAAGGPIVVAQDGSGQYSTITEAVAVATDGDEILVRPGTYPEVLVVDKDITLRGDGPREEVILEFASDGPTISSGYAALPYGLMLVDTETTVAELTVRGPNVAAAFVFVGGAPTLEGVINELEGDFSGQPHTSVAILHGAGATIRDSFLDGPVWDVGAAPMPEYEDITGTRRFVIEDNAIDIGFWLGAVTDGSSIVRNTITDGGIELSLQGGGTALIAENELAVIELDEQPADGITIRGNVLLPTISDLAAISLSTGAPLIEDNVVTGTRTGVLVPSGGSPTIRGNQLEGLEVGIFVAGTETVAVIEGNRFCDTAQPVSVPEGEAYARTVIADANEVCEESAE